MKVASRWELQKLLLTLAAALAVAWCGVVLVALLRHLWFVDAHGNPRPTDFIEVWVAGKLVLSGTPATPYDWHAHHLAQVAAARHPFPGFFGWHYPPLFLFAAAGLALLPYLPAFGTWLAVTFAIYAPVVAKIAGRKEAALLAFAWPATLTNMITGQNGFLSGALIGGTLLFLDVQPVLAGIFLGLLTYKPQLGLLFPIVLAADRRWRVLASACLTAVVAGLILPYLAFGTGPFQAFVHFLPQTENAVLENGMAGWNKQQTILGLAHCLGAGAAAAWALYAVVAAVTAAGVLWLWRSRDVAPAVKAAALATGALVLTPYLYIYDLPVLVIPLAFLFRDKSFDREEWIGIAAINCLLLSFMWFAVPVGAVAILTVAGLIARRAIQSHRASCGMNLNLPLQARA